MLSKFSDTLCYNLNDVARCQLITRQERKVNVAIDGEMKLERVRVKDGSIARLPTENQKNKYGKTFVNI